MASAAANEPSTSTPLSPSDAELLDILYEILADDTGEQHGVSTEAIEGFLHESARTERKAGALAAFFQQHGLSTRAEDYGRDPALAVVPSGLHMAPLGLGTSPSGVSPAPDWAAPLGGASPESSQPLASEPSPRAASYVRATAPAARRPVWLVATLVGLVLLACVAGAIATITAMQEQQLERELTLSNMQLRSTGAAVDALRSEAVRLNGELQQTRSAEQALEMQVKHLVQVEEARQQTAAEEEARRAARFGRRRVAPARPAAPVATP